MSDTPERMEVQRPIEATPAEIFAVVSDPNGHVAIDVSGMLQSADGQPAKAVGDTFVVHMDREALNDFPLGQVRRHGRDRHLRAGPRDRVEDRRGGPATDRPHLRLPARARRRRHPGDELLRLVDDRSGVARGATSSRSSPRPRCRATLGILDRTVKRGYPKP